MEAVELGRALREGASRARNELPTAAAAGLRQALVGPEPRGGATRRRLDRLVRIVGGAIVALAVALVVISVVSGHAQPRLFLPLVAVVVPLALAIHLPLLGWRVAWLATALAPLIPQQQRLDPAQVAVLLVLFGVAAARYGRPTSWAIWAVTLIPFWIWAGSGWHGPALASVALTMLCVAIDVLNAWHETRVALRAQARRTQTEAERRAVLEERARIAREMHDLVAHHLSMIAVATATAPYRLPAISEQVREEFDMLNGTARIALAYIRSLLGALHNEQPAERSPQPLLTDIPELVTATRRAGLPVELQMPAGTGALRPVLGVAAYRIVQEALSNAARHAPGATVTVAINRTPQRLCIRVSNTRSPTSRPPPGAGRGGHGLRGMQERVALLDGTLTARSARDGGFVVSAVLPVRLRADER